MSDYTGEEHRHMDGAEECEECSPGGRSEAEPGERRIERQGESSENKVYIGKKPTMNYVLAVITQFNNGMSEVTIKARGKTISKAVDVKEIVKNRFLPDLMDKSISTATEELMNEDGTRSKVSTIQIVIAK